MKSYTDLEQSKKLAEILPIESADMWFHPYPNDEDWYEVPNVGGAEIKYNELPCWSLSALLNALPQDTISLTGNCKEPYWLCEYVDSNNKSYLGDSADNPIDACYNLILKLHELNLL